MEDRALLSVSSVDPTFGDHGTLVTRLTRGGAPVDSYPGRLIILPDGKALGTSGATESADQFPLFRIDAQGALDPGFGDRGWGRPNPDPTRGVQFVADLALQSDGRIIAGGTTVASPTSRKIAVARYNANGTPDLTFGSSGIALRAFPGTFTSLTSIAVDAQDRVVVGGDSNGWVIIRLKPNGALDPTFGTGGVVRAAGSHYPQDLAIQPDGKIIAAGPSDTQSSGRVHMRVMRLNPDGSRDASFAGDGDLDIAPPSAGPANGVAQAVTLTREGRILVGGVEQLTPNGAILPGNFDLYALNSDGTFDDSFGQGGRVETQFPEFTDYCQAAISALTVGDDGTIYAGGYVTSLPPGAQTITGYGGALAAYKPDGSPLRSFGVNGRIVSPAFKSIESLGFTPEGKLLAYGGKWPDVALQRFEMTPAVQLSVAPAGPAASAENPEGLGAVASFRLERNGDLTESLKVLYDVAGDAVNGVDYATLAGTAIFPAGADSIDVPVRARDDYLLEGTETVQITPRTPPGYRRVGNESAVITILDDEGPDRLEPNDGFEGATGLGLLISRRERHLTIDHPADEDFFAFEAVGKGYFTADVAFDPGLGGLTIEIYDAAHVLVARGAPEAPSDRAARLSLPLPAGAYFLRVAPAAGATAYFDYDLTAALRLDPALLARKVFYNHSAYADSAAPDKSALAPGGRPTADNITSYARGLNGLFVDLAGAAPGGGGPGRGDVVAADFEFAIASPAGGWSPAPAPDTVTQRSSAGAAGSDRVLITWPDGAIKNTWLRVTVKTGPRTNLSSPDVFYFGNLIGDTGDGIAADARVNASDLARVKRALNTDSSINGRFDFNRDGRVNAQDLATVRANLNRRLQAPPAPPVVPALRPDAILHDELDLLLQ